MGKILALLLFSIEITSGKIDSLKDLKSVDITIMGVKLGSTAKEVKGKIGEPLLQNESQMMWIYPQMILYFDKGGRVKKISLKKQFRERLKGKLKEVFSGRVFEDESFRHEVLGSEVEIKVENIEMSRIKVEKWIYDFGNGILLEGSKKSGGFVFQFLSFVNEKGK